MRGRDDPTGRARRCPTAHPLYLLYAGSPKQREIDHVEPAQDAVDDRPEDRMVAGVGDRDGERRAKTHTVFRALDANAVISISVHGDPSDAKGVDWSRVRRSVTR